jgi:predicted nucleic acid-binding protein
MNKIFVDTNIIIDLLQKRESFYKDAQQLFTLADNKQVKLYISALSIANTHYILSKHLKEDARIVLLKFKSLVEILPLNDTVITTSLNSNFIDFEDSIQYQTAIENFMDCIITRNKKDFTNAKIPILTANEYLNNYNL